MTRSASSPNPRISSHRAPGRLRPATAADPCEVGNARVETIRCEVYDRPFVANATSSGGHAGRIKESVMFWTRRIPPVVAVAATILASQTGLAAAATVAVGNHHLVYTAIGADVNDLRVARHSGIFVVRDLESTLVAGVGCTSVTVHKAACPATGVRAFSAALGPGADRAVVSNLLRLPTIVVRAGLGADTLESVVAHVEFRGGPGRDRVLGGLRADVLLGGRGADFIRGRGGADRLYGGAGDDLMIAGPGLDRAFGQAGDDEIHGGTGSDRLQGGPGEDNLDDFSGHDLLFGGRAADYLNTFEIVPDGRPGDYLNAGAGPDYGCRATPDDILVGCDEAAK
jgi:Ca2+-binding RTX toxin-like protein